MKDSDSVMVWRAFSGSGGMGRYISCPWMRIWGETSILRCWRSIHCLFPRFMAVTCSCTIVHLAIVQGISMIGFGDTRRDRASHVISSHDFLILLYFEVFPVHISYGILRSIIHLYIAVADEFMNTVQSVRSFCTISKQKIDEAPTTIEHMTNCNCDSLFCVEKWQVEEIC